MALGDDVQETALRYDIALDLIAHAFRQEPFRAEWFVTDMLSLHPNDSMRALAQKKRPDKPGVDGDFCNEADQAVMRSSFSFGSRST
jgi:hypothetical protein